MQDIHSPSPSHLSYLIPSVPSASFPNTPPVFPLPLFWSHPLSCITCTAAATFYLFFFFFASILVPLYILHRNTQVISFIYKQSTEVITSQVCRHCHTVFWSMSCSREVQDQLEYFLWKNTCLFYPIRPRGSIYLLFLLRVFAFQSTDW